MMVPDPIVLQLVRSLLEAAAEEMGIVLQRAAFSANIKERRDYSCALFDSTGRLLAQAAHIPVHLGSMPASVAAVIDCLGVLNDGDVAIVNDPYYGGSHLPDITLISPVYLESNLIGYAASRAHHSDVGGAWAGSMGLASHIDQEGHRMTPALLYARGVINSAVLDPFLKAVRTPMERLGDLDAQLAANALGIREVKQLARQFGRQSLAEYSQALLDYSAAFFARMLREIPEGTYTFEDALDDDGLTAAPIRVHVKLTLTGERAIADLTNTADAVGGPLNCPRAVACSAVYYCFVCLLEEKVPLNDGSFRNIDVITRTGSLVDAIFPSPVAAGNTETSQRIVDAVLGALFKAIPHRIPAASAGSMSSLALGSTHPAPWTYYETIPGGSGGGPTSPGESAIQTHMTNTLNTPAEALEMQYPLRVRRFELAQNTGGDGLFPGGNGVVRELEFLGDANGTILSDRRKYGPWGLSGGSAGSTGRNVLVSPNGIETPLGGKDHFRVQAGDRIKIVTPGGGGWGKATNDLPHSHTRSAF